MRPPQAEVEDPDGLPERPEQCYECGREPEPFETFGLYTIDADPGDPEVGPQPDIIEVPFCRDCAPRRKEA